MASSSRRWVFTLCVVASFLQVLSQGPGLRVPRRAGSVFLRPKRANSFFVEEMLQGNLERECYEERCNYEEAREYFENTPMTIAFWTTYYDGDQCLTNPCLHDGNCTDRVGGFLCSCRAPYYGLNCELGTAERKRERPSTAPLNNQPAEVQCAVHGPSACHHFCSVSPNTFVCSCAEGYKLQPDGRSCQPEVDFPCGTWMTPSPDAATLNKTPQAPHRCPDELCPWQVSLVDGGGVELCQGVVLSHRSVLTSAQCLFMANGTQIQASSLHVLAGQRSSTQKTAVQAASTHGRFQTGRYDNDLALLHLAKPLVFGPTLFNLCLPTKDFSENVLMHAGRVGLMGGGRSFTHLSLDDCRRLNVSHLISNKMFCIRTIIEGVPGTESQHGGGQTGLVGGCGLQRGTPTASIQQGAAFLTGLMASQQGRCGALVFTKLSRYLPWIRQRAALSKKDQRDPDIPRNPDPQNHPPVPDLIPEFRQYPDPTVPKKPAQVMEYPEPPVLKIIPQMRQYPDPSVPKMTVQIIEYPDPPVPQITPSSDSTLTAPRTPK